MPSNKVLSRYPVMRLLVPLIAGIILGNITGIHALLTSIISIVAGIALYITLALCSPSPTARHRALPYFTAAIAIIAMGTGCLAIALCTPKPLDLKVINHNKIATGRIDDISFKDFSMQLTVSLTGCYDSSKRLPLHAKAKITTRGCDYALNSGDLIAFKSQLEPVKNMGNPDEVDYAGILRRQGIYYQQHLPVKKIVRYGHHDDLLSWLAGRRNALQHDIVNSRLGEASQKMVIALILGNKTFIDQDTRWQYSNAGVAHILALSGLHVGILSIIIWWILMPLDYLRLKKLRLLITIVAVAAFDLFTGMSPSVVRASVMIASVLVAHILYRKSTPLNALLAAALFILAFDPNALLDVGFQLSFITVASILIFTPERAPAGSYTAWQGLKATVATSVIAMAATLILTAYYFHSISVLSVLSNVLILPIFPFFMIAAAFYVILLALGGELQVLDSLIDSIYGYINMVVTTIAGTPLSYIDGIYLTGIEVITFYVILIMAVVAYKMRTTRLYIPAGIVLLGTLLYECWLGWSTPTSGMVIFNSYNSTPILQFENHKGYLWVCDDDDVDIDGFKRQHMAFLAHHKVNEIKWVTDTLHLKDAFFKPPYCYAGGVSMVTVGGGKWKSATISRRLPMDYMILTKRCHAHVDDLLRLYEPRQVVISGDVYSTDESRVIHQCDSIGIRYIAIGRTGAITKYCN